MGSQNMIDPRSAWMDDVKVRKLAQKVLDTEEEPVPEFFLPLLKKYMRESPYDTNFIIELAQKRRPAQGGNGFGTITCMESKCWTDIILDADPDRPKGGKEDGFGSFFNYRTHCQDQNHVDGRNERLSAEGIPFRPAFPDPAPSASSFIRAQSSSSMAKSSQSYAPPSSSPLACRNGNLPEVKPSGFLNPTSSKGKGKGKAPARGLASDPIYISSDEDDDQRVLKKITPQKRLLVGSGTEDDDEVEVLDGDRIPANMIKITNKDAPYVLSDDEDSHPTRITSVLAPLSGLSAALAADKAERASRMKEEKAKKVKENRRTQSAAWTKLLTPATALVVPLSQQGQSSQPPSSQPTRSTSATGSGGPHYKSVGQSEPRTVIIPPVQSAVYAQTWWNNEMARARNRERRARGSPEEEALDPTRPSLQDYVFYGSAVRAKNLVDAEYKMCLQMWRDCGGLGPLAKDTIRERIRQLSMTLKTPQRYQTPGLPFLLLGSSNLERLWEDILPFKSARQIAHAASMRDSSVPTTGTSRTSSCLDTIKEALAAVNEQAKYLSQRAIENAGLGEVAGPSRPFSPTETVSLAGRVPPGYMPVRMPGGMGGVMDMADINSGRVTSFDMGAVDYSPIGYEPDRPVTDEGLSDLFKTALDDFHEDTDVDTALQGLGLQRLEDKIAGLNVQLMPHQVLGVHWMVQQEQKSANQGGILGDMMGLGKTVQAIATMVKNPSKDRKIKTTLVVLPLPLIQQWKAEIEAKSGLTVYVYHGPGRTKSTNQLKNVDCVLTTYSIVANEAADLIEGSKAKKKRTDDWISDDEEPKRNAIKKKGPLYKMAWYRIILDEAAVIRNKSTKASKAIHELVGDIRWCLTGTLIYNSLTDIYPYLRFIGIIDWEDFRERIHTISRRQPRLACRRAQVILRRVMLRRTKDSELNGRKILQLPPKTVDMVEMDFTEEERQIYAAIEAAARVKVNKWYKAGTLLKQYHVVLVMLIRLRQLCCHPWLLRASDEYRETHGNNIIDVEDAEDTKEGLTTTPAELTDLEELQRAIRERGEAWVDKTKKKLEERYQNMLQEKEGDENDHSCAVCFEPFNDERVTSCHHSFCASCIEGILSSAPRDEVVADERVRHSRPCPLCRHEVTREELYRAKAFFDPEEYDDVEDEVKPFPLFAKSSQTVDQKPTAADLKGKGKAKAEPDEKIEGIETQLGDVGIEDALPSTKMRKIADLLDLWHDVDPTQKTLIFCSFVEMLELMSVFLRKRDIKHVMYTGAMKVDDRDEAIRKFQQPGEGTPRVMLISLKCGGVGLNLTAANNVIGLDLAWSPASEAQAVDRAHRIGQTRPVTVKRLIIRDSVEQRILELQEKKQMLADGAMGEGNGGRIGRLSAREIVALFGNDNQDE